MEIWKVAGITLLSRPAAGKPTQEATLPCLTVAWTASNDHGADTEDTCETGYLLATGLEVEGLQDLPWQPAVVRFEVRGAMEPREFQIGNYVVEDAAQGIVRFTIP